ncbi:MAG: hypothetical protein ACYC61_24575 [Isosphaeraceae bacterium]
MSVDDACVDDARPDTGAASRPGPRWVRRAVSLWLLLHLSAIVIAPASVAPASEVVRGACRLLQPYLGALYLDHGYHFFAPEPAESTLLAYEAERPDGTVVRGRIPDRSTHPRLLYHRYFMLTEHMSEAPEEVAELWYASYAEHIARDQGASRVRLIQQTHNLSTMERVRDGGRLDDPEGYEDEELGVFP